MFFAVVAMLQIFLLNNLTVSVRFAPMVYVVCLVMLPLEISQMRILLVGLLLGVLMDVTMGVNGLNVVATLPVAFFRRPILHFVAGFSDLAKADGVPCACGRRGRLRDNRGKGDAVGHEGEDCRA